MSADEIHLLHTIWDAVLTGAITGLGTIGWWMLRRFVKRVDDKLDRTEFKQLRSDLQDRWQQQDTMWRRQETMHSENRRRLDRILERLAGLGGQNGT